jgi:misacylated tRNA(Ala) deacylase
MRTETIYAVDSAVREIETSVLAVEGDEVALERTIFYPGGGGRARYLPG